jgi:hypothetical protein
LLVAGSYAPLLLPPRLFTHPGMFFFGYPMIPGNVQALAATCSAVGVIFISEGVCEKLGAPSLWRRLTGGVPALARLAVAAAASGLVLELFAHRWRGCSAR